MGRDMPALVPRDGATHIHYSLPDVTGKPQSLSVGDSVSHMQPDMPIPASAHKLVTSAVP